MDARRSSLLQEANTLLLNAGFRHHTIANNEELQLNASSMLVALFEALLDVYMPQVKRKPETVRNGSRRPCKCTDRAWVAG